MMTERNDPLRRPASGAQPLAMLVDDSPAIREVLSDMLVDQGFRVVAFGDGRTALAAMREPGAAVPDIVFLDLRMPAVNGYQFLDEVRAEAQYASVPIVILTFAVEQSEIGEALRLGAAEHLDKVNLSPESVRAVIARHINRIGAPANR